MYLPEPIGEPCQIISVYEFHGEFVVSDNVSGYATLTQDDVENDNDSMFNNFPNYETHSQEIWQQLERLASCPCI